MRNIIAFFFVLLSLSFLGKAYAESVPTYALDKDYENCMGSESEQSNPERARFCDCARNKMKEWDLDTYGAAASEAAKDPKNTAAVSQQIGDIAKACLAQVFK